MRSRLPLAACTILAGLTIGCGSDHEYNTTAGDTTAADAVAKAPGPKSKAPPKGNKPTPGGKAAGALPKRPID